MISVLGKMNYFESNIFFMGVGWGGYKKTNSHNIETRKIFKCQKFSKYKGGENCFSFFFAFLRELGYIRKKKISKNFLSVRMGHN